MGALQDHRSGQLQIRDTDDEGIFVGIFKDSSGYMLMTTDRSSISENETFQFVMYGLASPVVIQ